MKTKEENLNMSRRISAEVAAAGGRAYYVGGFVRDRVMGKEKEAADIDIEVHGIAPDTLHAILDGLGGVMTVGESFGIYSLRSYGIDVAMPRLETATGRGHRDFETFVDPFIGPEKAAMRRDFTCNALMEDVLSGEILDYFGGLEDIKNKILRHVSGRSFPEDPLRVLRAAQFSARLGFAVAPETTELCRRIPLDTLSAERVEGELKKALLQAERPSVFFAVLRACGQLGTWFPEAETLIGVGQNPRFHAEGDVWNHTMLVLDEAAKVRGKAKEPYYFMLSALCHDFGKPATTEVIDGVLHSYGHETVGVPVASQFVRRLSHEKKLTKYVENMVLLHMQPCVLALQDASVKSTNKLFDKSVLPHDLILVALSDSHGMRHEYPYVDKEDWMWERLRLYEELMAQPAVTGDDLIRAGLRPDGNFKEILSYAHKLHLAGIPKENALVQTLRYAEKLKN